MVDVDDIEAVLAAAVAAGGQRVNEVSEVPGVGLTAYLKDTEGNLFSLMQSFGEEAGG